MDSLIALVILSVALTALAVAYRQVSVTSYAATNMAQANFIAQSQLEQLKQTYDGITYPSGGIATTTKQQISNGVTYSVTYTQMAAPSFLTSTGGVNSSSNHVVPVKVTVTWSGGAVNLAENIYFK